MSIVYFASAGDSGCGAQWPSSSPWVVSAGGTTINRDPKTHKFLGESCWSGSGGGTSAEETFGSGFPGGTGAWANFQYPLFGQTARATPDLAFEADPLSGVNVYSQFGSTSVPGATSPWVIVGGTSVASPALAGLVNLAGNKLGSNISPPAAGLSDGFYNNEEDNLLYSQLPSATYPKNFSDITTGTNGCTVATSWDYCTGVGSPRGLIGK